MPSFRTILTIAIVCLLVMFLVNRTPQLKAAVS
jgi:hypothetical protein